MPAGSMCRLAREGRTVLAYNEEAFRYFLEIECARAERSGRPVILVLARLSARPRIAAAVAQKLFGGLWLCIRETDFIGWYHEGRTAGAVLTQRPGVSLADVTREIRARVSDALGQALPPRARRRLRVHVWPLLPASAGREEGRNPIAHVAS